MRPQRAVMRAAQLLPGDGRAPLKRRGSRQPACQSAELRGGLAHASSCGLCWRGVDVMLLTSLSSLGLAPVTLGG